VILFLHNRYRTTGGEERTVADLRRVVGERLGEQVELLQRDSAVLGPAAAAAGLLRGGLGEDEVGHAVRRCGARVVHAHNLLPAFGWRALAAAREAGARTVLHLHNYRLVCAVAVCYTHGAECTRCHGRNTLPGVLLNCRGSRPEAALYGLSLARWQRRMLEQADAVIVPSAFAHERLTALGAPLPPGRVHVIAPPVAGAPAHPGARRDPAPTTDGRVALVTSRLAPEKGVDVAIDACRMAGVPLVVAGEGPERAALEARAADADVRFAGWLDAHALGALRERAAVALVPSRSAETFGLSAAEAMAAGVPVAASRIGALPELVDAAGLAPPGDAQALAAVVRRRWGDADAARRGRERVREVASEDAVAAALAQVYAAVGPSGHA
jgi:glycosyltransferase involved in cell wall biosynthesis